MNSGREDRKQRLINPRSGAWASSSQDYIRLATLIFEQSATYAKSIDNNCSLYSLAGVPVLFSAFRAVLVEANSGLFGRVIRRDLLSELAAAPNELNFFKKYYIPTQDLAVQLAIMYEVRNEMVHPSHMPAGTSHGTPSYLLALRDQGILQTTNRADGDYNWIAQLQSHRLFTHAFATIESVAEIVLSKHHSTEDTAAMHVASYARYRSISSRVFD
jgi:hypothetical protein